MSQSLAPGWVDAIRAEVQSKDEVKRSEALGCKPRRCFRVAPADRAQSYRRGSARGPASRFALKNLPPVDPDGEDQP
jgi:hypothetical protein